MKILIRGGGFLNKGAEAMVKTVRSELGRRLDNSIFYVDVPKEQAPQANLIGMLPIRTGDLTQNILFSLSRRLGHHKVITSIIIGRTIHLQRTQMRGTGMVVDVSGFSYLDQWGPLPTQIALAIVNNCRKNNMPSVFFPQSWGPFERKDLAATMEQICWSASAIYARDEQSFLSLKRVAGDNSSKIKIAPDVAFRFRGAPPDTGAAILDRLGIRIGRRPIIGIAPNTQVYKRTAGKGINNSYVKMLINLSKYCMNELQASVVLVPHQISNRPAQDDRHLCSLINHTVKDQYLVSAIGEYSAEHIKAIIANFDLLVGSRFHAIVSASSCRVPAVALGWANKYNELMYQVGLGDYVLHFENFGIEKAKEMVSVAWVHREQKRQILIERLPIIEKEVDAMFDHVTHIVQQHVH